MTSPGEAIPAIEIQDLVVEAGGRRILDAVTLRLDAPRVALIGSNGSGKSTLLRVLDGLTSPASGSVRVLGLDPERAGRELRRHVGFVFTDPDAQIIMPTVREDLAFSLRGSGLSRAQAADEVDGWLRRHGLESHADTPAHQLSGGQKQLLALGAVLIRHPDLVLADEPTTMLDLPNARRVGEVLLNGPTRQVIIATHDLPLAERCDLAVRLSAGTVTAIGDPRTLIADYRREFE